MGDDNQVANRRWMFGRIDCGLSGAQALGGIAHGALCLMNPPALDEGIGFIQPPNCLFHVDLRLGVRMGDGDGHDLHESLHGVKRTVRE